MRKEKQGKQQEKNLNKLEVIRNTLHYEYLNIVRLRFKQIDVKKWIEVYCEKLIDLISKSGQT